MMVGNKVHKFRALTTRICRVQTLRGCAHGFNEPQEMIGKTDESEDSHHAIPDYQALFEFMR